MTERSEHEFIIMGFDPLFKKMFGDVNYTNKAAAIIGIILNIPFEKIKDRVEILNNEKVRINKKDKPQEQDVLVHIRLKSEKYFVNLEANINGYNEEGINRNTGYIANTYSRQLDKKEKYKYLEPVIQINFNSSSSRIKNKGLNKPIDIFLLRNDDGMVLTQMIKIINVDIDMCYDMWYNRDIEKFTSCEQNIIKIGALHKVGNDELFRKCLGDIDMDEHVKEKMLHDMVEYQQDKELAMVYDKEMHDEYIRQSKQRDLDLYKDELDAKKIQMDEQKQQMDEQKQQMDEQKQQMDEQKQQMDEQKQQISNELEKLSKKKVDFAKQLLDFGKNISEVSIITGLSIDYINKELINK